MNDAQPDVPTSHNVLWSLQLFFARRPNLTACLALLILSLGIIGVNPLKQTLAPMDLLLSFPGWDNANVDTPLVNMERSDALDHRLPHWRFFRSELRQGRIPFWNPLHQLGAPGIELPAYEGLTLPFLIFAVVPDESLGYTLAVISNFLLAAFGTYLLLFFMFRNRTAAVFGALIFAFTGFNVAWAHWPHLSTSAWIPWVLAAQLRYWQTVKFAWGLLFAFSVAALGLGGFPFVTILGAISAIFLGIVLIVPYVSKGIPVRTMIWRLTGLALAGIAGVVMAYPALSQLLNMLEHTDLSHRNGGTALSLANLPHLLGSDWTTRITVENTFFSGTLAAIFAVVAAACCAYRPNRHAFFGLLIGIFVLATTYGAAPSSFILAIPFFDINPWNRVGLLVGLCFAVLSAYLLTLYQTSEWYYKNQRLAASLLFCAFAAQTGQIAYQFHVYNAKPPRETYFPATPSLTYVKSHIDPLQSVVADQSFLVSGTLSNYGMPEIMAHGFRTEAQRQILEKIAPGSVASVTATVADCAILQYSNNDTTYAGVRYFFQKNPCPSVMMKQDGEGQKPSALLNQGAFTGTLTLVEAIHPDDIQVMFGTYETNFFTSDLRLQLFLNGRLVAQSDIAGTQIANNRYASFPLNLDQQLAAGNYTYTITIIHPVPGSRLSVWTFEQSGDATYRVGTNEFRGAAKLRLVSWPKRSDNLVVHEMEPDIAVVENRLVTGSGYLVATLDGEPKPDYSRIHLNSYIPTDFEFSYDGTDKGWFIVPMRMANEWNVTVNGKPVATSLFRGFYPAVQLEGPSTIHFAYNPAAFLLCLKLATGMAILCLIALYLVSRRVEAVKHPANPERTSPA